MTENTQSWLAKITTHMVVYALAITSEKKTSQRMESDSISYFHPNKSVL